MSFSRLVPFDKSEWTEQEQQLLRQFSIDFFKHCLSTYPIPSFNDSIDTIIIMFWRAGFDISYLLSIWENEKTKESVLHFRDLNFHGFDQYNQTKLFSSFADKELADKLRNWLDKDEVRQNFLDAIERVIIEQSDLEEGDLNELNLLYDITRTKKNGQ